MPAGSFQPNNLGLYDMSGNVWSGAGIGMVHILGQDKAIIQESAKESIACCAAVPGTSIRGMCALPFASTGGRLSGATMLVFVL